MTSLTLQPNKLNVAETLASAPILVAFMIGSLPVLIPLLLIRRVLRQAPRS